MGIPKPRNFELMQTTFWVLPNRCIRIIMYICGGLIALLQLNITQKYYEYSFPRISAINQP